MNQRDESTHELISAYLDGELTQDERARAERLLQTSPAHQESLQAMQFVRGAMQTLPRYRLDEGVSDRVLVAARETQRSRRVRPGRMSRGAPQWRLKTPNRRRRWYFGVSVVAGAAAALLSIFFLGSPPDDADDGPATGSVAAVDQSRGDDSRDDAMEARRERHRAPLEARGKRTATRKESSGTSPSLSPPASKMAAKSAPADVPSSESLSREVEPDIEPGALASSGAATDSGASSVDRSPDPEPKAPSGGARPNIPLGPGELSQELLVVIEVKMTRSGWKTGAFERILTEAGVAFDANLSMGPELKTALLESRFFRPSSDVQERAADEPTAPVTIVYVDAPAGALDRAWRRMKQDEAHFTRVSLDVALRPQDMSVFDQLRQSSVGDTTPPPDTKRNAEGIARQLELPPSWDGMFADEASNPAGLADSAAKASNSHRAEALEDDQSQPKLPGLFGPSNGELGGNIRMEAMFVLQGVSPQPDP
ncbi:MAG: anti-sigma factor family protein [Planctomycetota bacterium]